MSAASPSLNPLPMNVQQIDFLRDTPALCSRAECACIRTFSYLRNQKSGMQLR
jgi:hypothetical protein